MTLFLIVFAVIFLFVAKNIYKKEYSEMVYNECSKYNIDEYVVFSIIKTESNFKADALSHKEAIGLMQLTMDTANWCAEKLDMEKIDKVNLYKPEINIKLGVFYFNYLLEKYNDFDTAIAAYNAGMGNVEKWLKNSEYSDDATKIIKTPYNETNLYITKVNNNLKIYKFLYEGLKL